MERGDGVPAADSRSDSESSLARMPISKDELAKMTQNMPYPDGLSDEQMRKTVAAVAAAETGCSPT